MLKDLLKGLDWKEIAYKLYLAILPKLEKMVLDSENKLDDLALNAIKVLADKFLKEEKEEEPKEIEA